MLRTVLEDDTKWDEHLALVEHAYNSTVQASTGYTPFYLVFGRERPSPMTRLAEALNQGPTNYAVQDQLEGWKKLHRQVVQKVTAAQKRMVKNADAKRQPVEYTVGDQVMLRLADYDKSDLPKLRKQWAGPFTVTQIVNPAAVRLELTGAYRRLHPVVHVSKVKHWVPDDAGRDVPQPPAVELA
ncbi:MAG: hypothetical protein OIF57_09480, partial [Marinobacterium sp.]|nr:hypothetical protein [Marinobacterium sp.]